MPAYNIKVSGCGLEYLWSGMHLYKVFELLVWPHEVGTWLRSWYRGRVLKIVALFSVTT